MKNIVCVSVCKNIIRTVIFHNTGLVYFYPTIKQKLMYLMFCGGWNQIFYFVLLLSENWEETSGVHRNILEQNLVPMMKSNGQRKAFFLMCDTPITS